MKKIKTQEELHIEIKQLEAKISELEQSNLQSCTCLENSPVCTKIIDLDFNLQYMSNAGIGALQIDDVSTFYGKPYPLFFFPSAYKIGMSENLLRVKETGETIMQEGEILDVKGNKLWFQATITPVYNKQGRMDHILVVSIDASTRKQAGEELKISMEREKELADMVRLSPVAMAFGYPDGRLTNCNSAFSVLTGYTISELQNINWNKVLTPPKWNAIEEEQLSKLGPSLKSVKYEKEYIHKDGHIVPIELTASAKFDSAGNLLHYIGFAVDIADRKLAEKELKASEERFELAMAAAKDGLFDWNLLTNEIYYSPGWKRMLGYDDNEIANEVSVWEKLTKPEDVEKSWKIQQEVINKERDRFEIEFKMKHKDGHWVDILARADAFFDENDKAFRMVGTHVDITERKKTEQLILQNKNRLEYALLSIETGAWELDLVNKSAWRSLKHDQIFGYEKLLPEWTFEMFLEHVLVEDREEVNEKFQQALLTKTDWSFECRIMRSDGNIRWIYANGAQEFDNNKAIKMFGIVQDITEKRLTEDKILTTEENLQNTFDLSPSIIAKANLNTGYFLEANKAVTRMLGYSVEEFISIPFMDLIHPINKQDAAFEISNHLRGRDITFYENQFLCKDGSYKWIAWHGNKVDENGIITAIGSNINKRKDTEIQLKEALEKALESDRLKSAFLANMSHEIRTPMNGIRGFINLLKEPDLSKSEINKYSDIINKSSDRLMNTINDIIDLSRIEAGEMIVSKDETYINSIVDELASFYTPEAKLKGLSLLLKPSAEPLTMITDSHKLFGIWSNLIKNAIKYTNEGSITFGYFLQNNIAPVDNEQALSSNVHFFVEDTGTGVPKERMKAIFNRFEQADIEDKKALEGSGLGLAISKAYIDMLGGDIFVDSVPGKGSKFTFTIPHNKIKKEDKMKISKTIDNKISKLENLNVLVVEDDETSTIYFKAMLEGIFQKIIFVKNGVDAIQLCKNDSEVDLVLMDIKMSEMDGYDATQEIRKFNKDLVIIAQTAYALQGDKEKAIEAGCNDYITKPIIKTQLLELISKHVGNCSI